LQNWYSKSRRSTRRCGRRPDIADLHEEDELSHCHTSSIVVHVICHRCGAWRGRSRRATLADSLPFRVCFLPHLSGCPELVVHMPLAHFQTGLLLWHECGAVGKPLILRRIRYIDPRHQLKLVELASFRQQPTILLSLIGPVVDVSSKCEAGSAK